MNEGMERRYPLITPMYANYYVPIFFKYFIIRFGGLFFNRVIICRISFVKTVLKRGPHRSGDLLPQERDKILSKNIGFFQPGSYFGERRWVRASWINTRAVPPNSFYANQMVTNAVQM